ncbi:MAG: 50S ribosomal protein L32 [Pseudomonadota bacterium]
MAVPARRKSKGRKNQRRAHHMIVDAPSLAICPQCKRPKMPHRVCIQCGFYKGREIVKQAV